MYLEYWGFEKFPFENVPDPDFFYLSKIHEEGLDRLIYAAKMRKGGAMLSGDIGCGKTTLTKVYVQKLSAEQFDIGLIINPKLEPLEFLQEVLYQLGMPDVPESKRECLRLLSEKMNENAKAQKNTLLIVDEAQALDESGFEEVRLLLNNQVNGGYGMNVVLVGQPELRGKIKDMEQLEQRIAIKYHLTPFDQEDTARYITFRQEKAGAKKSVFTSVAVERIYEITEGVPRKINNLCDLSLLVGFSKNGKMIDPQIIEDIMSDGALL
ncbi:MAG: AAA family ATPase [Desulfobacteraceae bacterium]|jgi:type II secretory pathway predicted ATPase ExeA